MHRHAPRKAADGFLVLPALPMLLAGYLWWQGDLTGENLVFVVAAAEIAIAMPTPKAGPLCMMKAPSAAA